MKGLFNLETKFGRLLHKLGQCVQLSVFWLLCSLPIITSGAASCALYATGRKVLRDEEGKLFDNYWKSFKNCLKQGSAVGVVTLVFCLVVAYCSLLLLPCAYSMLTVKPIESVFEIYKPSEEQENDD